MTRAMFFAAGGIIVAGGRSDSGYLSSTEGLGMKNLPDIPTSQSHFPLVLVGSIIYMCGGFPMTADCFTLNTKEPNPTWTQTTGLPQAIEAHSGVVIEEHIWYVQWTKLYDYNTVTGSTEQHTMPFTQAKRHCAVANGTHSYVVGVGGKRDEIWVNTVARNPLRWTMVARLPMTVRYLSCVWFQETIHIQGGFGNSRTPLKVAFALDVNSHFLTRIADLTIARRDARAGIVDCKPAVIGGVTSGTRHLTSIETYDGSTWTLHEMSLQTARELFGLVQFKN